MTDDPFDLPRFSTAQDGRDPNHRGVGWESITAELAAGRKHGHWMWFVFPRSTSATHPPRTTSRSCRGTRPWPIWQIPCSAHACVNAPA